MTRLCMFPGQGSQFKGMGEDVFTCYPHLVSAASEVLDYDVKDMCLRSSPEQLSNTAVTQPLLYVVNALSYLRHVETTGIVPEYLAGHSLGEYAALFAAGSFDFITGLNLVAERGRLMSRIKGGAMYAIIGISSEDVVGVLAAEKNGELTIANYNSHTQTVIAGIIDNGDHLTEQFYAAGATSVVKLGVSACFHTLHMRDIADQYRQYLKRYRFSEPKIPVISNLTAHPYQPDDDIEDILVKQIYSPVLWLQSMEYLLPKVKGEWVEVGPGKVLSNLVGHIERRLDRVSSH